MNAAYAAYAAIEKVAKKLGYPEHWENDVYLHDRKFIEDHNPSSFAWCIRRYGSHMQHIGSELETPIMMDYAEAIAHSFRDGDPHFYIWKDGKLIHCKSAATWFDHIRQAERTRVHPAMQRKQELIRMGR